MKCVWEHNGSDTLLYSVDYIGAYTRGENLEAARAKMTGEIAAYAKWRGQIFDLDTDIDIIQEKDCDLKIADADSDVLFDTERAPLSREEYEELKNLALKSARDFYALYCSIPNKHESCLTPRKTFYGNVPTTAEQMYQHTKNVNAYYFAEINIDADNDGTIYDCRKRGFELLESASGFLENNVIEGSYGELWTLRKVLRRFLWHDRIHAKAMYRMAVKTFGSFGMNNTFRFNAD